VGGGGRETLWSAESWSIHAKGDKLISIVGKVYTVVDRKYLIKQQFVDTFCVLRAFMATHSTCLRSFSLLQVYEGGFLSSSLIISDRL
jgi:hypothetical protein